MKGIAAAILLSALLAGCVAPREGLDQAAARVSGDDKFACFPDARMIWMNALAVEDKRPASYIEDNVARDFPSAAARDKARQYLSDYASGSFASPEQVGARWFHECAQGTRSLKQVRLHDVERCFTAYRVTLDLYARMRAGTSEPVAVYEYITEKNYTSDPVVNRISAAAEELYRTIGNANPLSYAQARFNVCLEYPDRFGIDLNERR